MNFEKNEMKYAYLGMSDAERLYEKIKGSRKGITAFIKDAKKIASKTRKGSYIFKNEEALFEVLKTYLTTELKRKKISCFGELMQYDS